MSDTKERKVTPAGDNAYYTRALDATKGKYRFRFCMEEQKFYVYQDGYWQPKDELEILDMIDEVVRITDLNLNLQNNILGHMKRITKIRLDKFNATPLFNLQNYMVDPLGNNILAHKEDQYSTNRIPYNYDASAQCNLWVNTINEIFEGDVNKIEILQEFIGYCLVRQTNLEKALLLLGESRSGKSTILNTIQYLLGDKNCSHVPLKYLSNSQYTGMLVNKLVNIDGEVSKKAQDFEAEFKTIVTGHEVSCSPKYIMNFTFRPFCKLIMAANEFPKITDHSSAFYNRLILIPCNRVFNSKEQNINLRDELIKELPGIFNWAMAGLSRLNKRGKFPQNEFMQKAIEELEEENNPVNVFFNEHIETNVSGDFYIEKGELYEKFKLWAQKTNNYQLPLAKFSACVYKKFNKFTPKNTQHQATHKRIWRNLKYVEFKSTPPSPVDIGWETDKEAPSGHTSN